MSILSGWFRGAADGAADAGKAQDVAAKERENLADAMKWTCLIMNDDIDTACKGLDKGNSAFHSLGGSVAMFMRAVLGFEKEIMAETAAKLADSEARSWTEYKRVQRHGNVRTGSRIYPPGTEYEMMRAQAMLMGAVVGVLNESIVEAMKSFYKLRKALTILDGIAAEEAKALSSGSVPTVAATASEKVAEAALDNSSNSDSDRLPAYRETESGLQTPSGNTATSTNVTTPEQLPSDSDFDSSRPSTPLKLHAPATSDRELELEDPVDVFIHSGTNMCLGLLLVILSLVPPAFSRVLSVVGFHGDRERGIHMLWKSAVHDNINGAIAGAMLLGFYNGMLASVDILPHEEDYDEHADAVGPPTQRCKALMAKLRASYPDSKLWRIEESRFLANDKKLDEAVQLLQTGRASNMRQITGLNDFELSIDAMIMQNWELMRDSYLRCMENSDWSPSMYYYMAGCATVEVYRDAFHAGDEAEAKRHKAKAQDLLRKAPQAAGKKRLMARQLPMEVFLQRKIQKWEEQAKALGVDFIDAIGPSPAVEMIYVWNGKKRMAKRHMEQALANVGWERCTAGEAAVAKMRMEKDDVAICAIGTASFLQGLGRLEEAKKVLDEHVLCHDR